MPIPIKLIVVAIYQILFQMTLQWVQNNAQHNYMVKVMILSPRNSGKTTMLQQKIIQMYDQFPDCDILVMTDTKTDQKSKGTFAGLKQFLHKNCPQDLENWVFTGDRIFRKRNDGRIPNEIKMFSIQNVNENDENVSKDKYADRPISLLIIDEVQKIHNADILDNALATFTRQMRGEGDSHSMLIICGNPDEEALWVNEYYDVLTADPEWITLRPTYLDIINRLPKSTLAIIESAKRNAPDRYKRMYLGILNGLSELTTYGQFDEKKHLKSRADCDQTRMQYFFYGVDYASAIDALTGIPCPFMESGRVVALAERFRHSPKLTNTAGLAPSQQARLIVEHLMWLDRFYRITEEEVPIILSIDSAADSFAKQILNLQENYWCPPELRNTTYDIYAFWNNVAVCKYGKLKNKFKGTELVNDAFSMDALDIMRDDTGFRFYNKKDNMPPKCDQLVWELQNVRWDSVLGKRVLKKRIPNDCTDGLEYGIAPIFTNCHNLKDMEGRPFKIDLSNAKFNFDYKGDDE